MGAHTAKAKQKRSGTAERPSVLAQGSPQSRATSPKGSLRKAARAASNSAWARARTTRQGPSQPQKQRQPQLPSRHRHAPSPRTAAPSSLCDEGAQDARSRTGPRALQRRRP